MFLLTPVFGSNNIPNIIKIGFSVILSFIVLPLIDYPQFLIIKNIYQLVYFIFNEFINGLVFGFISMLILNSLYVAGDIVDKNIGFSIVNVISPQDETEIPMSANFYYTMAILIFLIIDGHHFIVESLLQSFKIINLGHSFLNSLSLNMLTELLNTSFVIGFKIAAPIIITIFISNVLLGVLSRAMPQMNVFVVGMPLKILVGLITLLVLLPLYFKVFINIFDIMFDYMQNFLKNLIRG